MQQDYIYHCKTELLMRKKKAKWKDWDKLGYSPMTGSYQHTQSNLQKLLSFYRFGSAATWNPSTLTNTPWPPLGQWGTWAMDGQF